MHSPQVLYLGHLLRYQQTKKLKVSDHPPYENENTASRWSRSRVMDHIWIKKATQSGERHHQATPDQHRVIPGHYNPSEEVTKISKIYKSYFIKIQTSVNRANSNAVVSAMEVWARQRRLEFKLKQYIMKRSINYKVNRDIMGAIPSVLSQLNTKETQKHTPFQKKRKKIVMRTKCK